MPKKSVLRLTLKKEYFAAIVAGEKKREYRERKPYWKTRLEGRHYDQILFRNGYSKSAPEMLVECRGMTLGRTDYILRLGRILSLKRWRR